MNAPFYVHILKEESKYCEIGLEFNWKSSWILFILHDLKSNSENVIKNLKPNDWLGVFVHSRSIHCYSHDTALYPQFSFFQNPLKSRTQATCSMSYK